MGSDFLKSDEHIFIIVGSRMYYLLVSAKVPKDIDKKSKNKKRPVDSLEFIPYEIYSVNLRGEVRVQ